MLKFRKFLCWCFGLFAVFFLIFSFGIFIVPLVHTYPPGHSSPSPKAYSLIFAPAFALGAPFAMAWWTVKRKKAFARSWAIIASLEIALISLLPLLPRHSISRRPHNFGIFDVALLILGIAGVIAFARRDAIEKTATEPAKPPRIAGDGTSKLLDRMAWVIGVFGYFVGRFLWAEWGRTHGLFWSRGFSAYALIFVALLITATLHECGHATVGIVLGMKLRAFIVGPFQWRIREGRWNFQFLPGNLFSAGGAAALVPTNPEQSHWNFIWMGAAGPLTNLVTGLIATYAALIAKGQPYEQYWQLLSLISTLSLVSFIVNLIPIRPEASYSDGARIYQLLRGGPWADLHRAMSIASSTMVTALRPRDYDIDAIQRASLSFTQGHQAVLLRLLATSYYLDHGMTSQACAALTEAESIVKESSLDLPAELCQAFVFRTAFLRKDALAARQWWERMEAKKPRHFGSEYWLAKSALLWSENHLEEAQEAWGKGDALAQKLPAAGDYEFDRYRSALLHKCLESAAVEVVG